MLINRRSATSGIARRSCCLVPSRCHLSGVHELLPGAQAVLSLTPLSTSRQNAPSPGCRRCRSAYFIFLGKAFFSAGVRRRASPTAFAGQPLAMKDVIKFRTPARRALVALPNGTDSSLGLRNFAKIRSEYALQPDGSAGLPRLDGSVSQPRTTPRLLCQRQGETVPPGWRVNIGLDNFAHIFFPKASASLPFHLRLTVVLPPPLSVLTWPLGLARWPDPPRPHLSYKPIHCQAADPALFVPVISDPRLGRGLFNQNFGEIPPYPGASFGADRAGTPTLVAGLMTILVVNIPPTLATPMMFSPWGSSRACRRTTRRPPRCRGATPSASSSPPLPQIIPAFLLLDRELLPSTPQHRSGVSLTRGGSRTCSGTIIPAGPDRHPGRLVPLPHAFSDRRSSWPLMPSR